VNSKWTGVWHEQRNGYIFNCLVIEFHYLKRESTCPHMHHLPFTGVLQYHCQTNKFYVGSEVLTAVVTKCSVFWALMLYSLLKVNLSFRGTYHLHPEPALFVPCVMLLSCMAYFLPLKMVEAFLHNIGWLSVDYMALYPRR
jgi:hypothetical protein